MNKRFKLNARKNTNYHIFETTASIASKFYSNKDRQVHFVGGPTMP